MGRAEIKSTADLLSKAGIGCKPKEILVAAFRETLRVKRKVHVK